MALAGREEGKVVAAVVDCGADDDQREPQPCHREVGPCDQWTPGHGGQVDDAVFHRVAVDGGYSHGSCPLVVRFVNAFVETRVMKKPRREEEQYRQP